MKIIADNNIPFLKGIVEHFGNVKYLAGSDFENQSIHKADALIVRTVTRFDETMLRNTRIKLICTATIGYDHIDTQYCEDHGITWVNAPGCNSGSVMQYVVSSLIILARKNNFNLREKTIGIVGIGNVGRKVAQACRLLGMKVLLNDPIRAKEEKDENQFVDLETIKREADIITFHTPLTKEGEYKTFHLADESFFATLGRKPIIINSARGGIIKTDAIKAAIRNKEISAAVIDCWENEPTIDTEYMEMVDIATPHIAGYSADGKANASRMSLMSIAEFYGLDKSPIELINEPMPANPIIDFEKFENSDCRLYDAILQTYNPMDDYAQLLVSPETFKQQRNEYPLRREYKAYSLQNATFDDLLLWNVLQHIK